MPVSTKALSASGLFVRWLPFLAFCTVIAHYFWFLNSHAINIPFQDDIYYFLQFVNLVETADSHSGAFEEWFRRYNDHRTNASRLLVYGAYLVEGEVNFHTLTLLANLALPLILLLFYCSVRREEYRWVYLLVSALLLLNLRSYYLVLWSQAAFAYYYVMFYAFACLFALHKVNLLKFMLAAVLCMLASFTYASGQLVWLLGLVSLLHQCLVTGRKPFIYPAMWLLVAITMLLLWHVGTSQPTGNISPDQAHLMLPDLLIDPPLHQALARYTAWFLVMLGCAFIDFSSLGAGAVGFFMIAVLSFVTVRFYKHEDIRLLLCAWFVVATVAAVCLGRAMFGSSDYILGQRYNFFSVVLMSTLTLQLQVRFKVFRTSAVYLVVMLAGMYWVWTYHHFESRLQVIMNQRYGAFNSGRFPVWGSPEPETTAIVREAIAAGIYNPPCTPFPLCETPQTRAE